MKIGTQKFKKHVWRVSSAFIPPLFVLGALEWFMKSPYYIPAFYPNLQSVVLLAAVVYVALQGGLLFGIAASLISIFYIFLTFNTSEGAFILAVSLPLLALIVGLLKEHTNQLFTKEQAAKHKAQAVKQRYLNLLDNLDAIVWEADATTLELNFISRRVQGALGYSHERWLKEPLFWLHTIHPDDREWVTNFLKKISKKASDRQLEYRIIGQDKQAIWFRNNINIEIRDQQAARLRGVMVDITDRKQLEARKDEFIGVASHELKTPLTTIKAFTQLLARHFAVLEDKKISRYLSKMDNQLDKLTTLVYDLLDVSKIQAGKMDLNKDVFDFDDLIQETIEDAQETIRHYIIRQGKANKKIMADKYRIEQVLTNLLSNAAKYSPQENKIVVHVAHSAENVTVSVEDSGIGIPKAKQGKIFDQFYTVDQKKAANPGLGLGLYIAREIIKRHGGDLWVKSDGKHGSRFFFSLPVGRPLTS